MNTAHGIQPETLSALIALVRQHTGIAMSERKSILLERRLRPRMQALEIASYQAYLDKVVRDSAEVPHFIDLVTTNDTLFFRTPQVWEYVEHEFLPQWWQAHAGRRLHIWSAAASSGEELYSVAILCAEFQAKAPGFSYQIHATDISQQILAQARAGHYAGRSVEKLRASHPEWVKKYFRTASDGLHVVDALKQNVELAQHNLLTPLKSRKQFDLVFLRNVLIYFDQDHQQIVLQQARHSMAPHARLILGESESISGLGLNTAYRCERPMIYSVEQQR